MPDYTSTRIWAMQGCDGGLVSNYPRHLIEGNESPDAENFQVSQNSIFKKRLGTSSFSGTHGSPLGTKVRGLGIFTFEDGTVKYIAKEGTATYDISAGNWSTTIGGYTPADGDEVYLTMFKNVVILTSSVYATPLKWTGSGSWASLGGSPASWAFCLPHKGRLFGLKTSADPSRFYYSAVNAHEDWSTADNAGNDYVGPGDGQVINGAASDGEYLYVSKQARGGEEGSIWVMYGQGPTDFQFKRACWFGAVNPRCIITTPQFVVFAAPNGIWAIQGRELLYLSESVNDQWLALTAAQRAEACIGYEGDRVYVSYPDTGATNTKALVVDVQRQIWSRHNWPTHTAPRIMATHPDGSLYGAAPSTTIRVIKYNTGVTDIGSTAISSYWTTPDIDFGAWHLDKLVKVFRLHCNNSQAVTWTLTHKIDNTDSGDSITMTGSTEGPVKRMQGRTADARGRFISFKFAEANTTITSEAYGLEAEAEIFTGPK